jgi:hypothetical protein
MQKAGYLLILVDRMPAQGPEWLKSAVLDKLSPQKGGRPYKDYVDSKTKIEAVEVGSQDFGSWAYVTITASMQFMTIWNHQPDLDRLRWQQFTGRIGNGAVVYTISESSVEVTTKPRAMISKPEPGADVADRQAMEQPTHKVKAVKKSATEPVGGKAAQATAPAVAHPVAAVPRPQVKNNVLAIVSAVVGVAALLGSCLGIIGIFLGPVALITGVIGSLQIKKSDGIQKGAKMAAAGMILGGASVILGIASVLASLILTLLSQNS